MTVTVINVLRDMTRGLLERYGKVGVKWRGIILRIVLVGACSLTAMAASDSTPDATPTSRRVLLIGSHVSDLDSLGVILSHAGYAEKVETVFLRTSTHPQAKDAWVKGVFMWLEGKDDLAEFNLSQRADHASFEACARGEMSAVVLELDAFDLQRDFDANRAAVVAFADMVKKIGKNGFILLMPDGMQATHKGDARKPESATPRTLDDYRAACHKLDKEYARALDGIDLPVIPVHRVFLALHELHPNVDIHPFVPGPGGGHYFSTREHYLLTCAVAAVLHPTRPAGLPDRKTVMKLDGDWQARYSSDYEGETTRGYEEPMDETIQQAIHDAVWAGVKGYEAERQAYWKRIPKTTFVLDSHEIPTGSSATLRWKVDGVDKVVIEPGIGEVPASGERVLKPSQTTTYTLQIPGLEKPHPTWTQELTVYELLPAVSVAGEMQPGLRVTVQEVEPNFAGKKLGELIAPRTAMDKTVPASVPANVPVDLVFSGFIKIEKPGLYRFLSMRGGNTVKAELSIDGRTAYPSTNSGDFALIGLAAGWHRVQGRFRTKDGLGKIGMWFDPGWSLPGKWPIRREVPRENVFWCEK